MGSCDSYPWTAKCPSNDTHPPLISLHEWRSSPGRGHEWLTAAQVVPILVQDTSAAVVHLPCKVLHIEVLGGEPLAEAEALTPRQLLPQLAAKAGVAALHKAVPLHFLPASLGPYHATAILCG